MMRGLVVFASILILTVDNCYGVTIICQGRGTYVGNIIFETISSTVYIIIIVDTISPTDSNNFNCTVTVSLALCDGDRLCWVLVGIGCVITAILLIAVIVFIIFTCLVAKGIKFLIQYFSTSANGEHDVERDHTQQQRQQNEGIVMSFYLIFILVLLHNIQQTMCKSFIIMLSFGYSTNNWTPHSRATV